MIGVIFDCDGVLIDSEKAHFLSWQKALRKHGVSCLLEKEEEYFSFVGTPAHVIVKRLGEKAHLESPAALVQDKNHFFEEFQQNGLPKMEKAIAFVQELAQMKKELGIKVGLASAAPRIELKSNLKRLGIEECFDVIVSGQDDLGEYHDPEGTNKPKPYIYLHAAKLLGLEPFQCLAFEDSHIGITAAATAGITAIAVPNAYTKGHDFKRAHRKIDSFSDIDMGRLEALLKPAPELASNYLQ